MLPEVFVKFEEITVSPFQIKCSHPIVHLNRINMIGFCTSQFNTLITWNEDLDHRNRSRKELSSVTLSVKLLLVSSSFPVQSVFQRKSFLQFHSNLSVTENTDESLHDSL